MTVKKRRQFIPGKMTSLLNLPPDITQGESFINIIGRSRIKLENHRGLMECTPQSVGVRLKKGLLRIGGEELVIAEILSDALEVTGEIRSVEFL
jgi:sporulation protein YqfC